MLQYDSGDPGACLDKALDVADWDGFAARKAKSATRGKLRGIGLCTYIEACGLAPSRIASRLGARGGLFESATVRVHPTGDITVLIGTHNHGQGHETTFAQIVSEKLGMPDRQASRSCSATPTRCSSASAPTARARSRSAVRRWPRRPTRSSPRASKIAAHMLEASEVDIEFEAGTFRVSGTDRTKIFERVAGAAYTPVNYPLEILEPGLEEQAFYDPVNFTYPGGAHIAEVEIDPEYRRRRACCPISRSTTSARVINPMIVAGQLHGGIVQGVGQALFENCVYDDDSGQLLSGSFMDYACRAPTACPTWRSRPSRRCARTTSFGVKGCGEVGTIGSPATVINAVVDALVASRRHPCRHAGHAKPHLADHQQQRATSARSRIGARR